MNRRDSPTSASCSSPPLSVEERRAIAALKRLAAQWPDSLWLFSANGTLNVMKKTPSRARATSDAGGYRPEFSVSTIQIESDGGDW